MARGKESPIFIRYTGKGDDDSLIPFAELGESLIGFDETIEHISRILRIECDVDLKLRATSRGSVILEGLVIFGSNASELFSSPEHFLEFARVAGGELLQDAQEILNSIDGDQQTLNEYFTKRPLDLAVIVACLTFLIAKAGKIGNKRKLKSDEEVVAEERDLIGERIAREIIGVLKRKVLVKAVKPVIEDSAESIEVDSTKEFKTPARIDQTNFLDYLTTEDQILPDLENERTYDFDGEIRSIKSTRGDSMTLCTRLEGKDHNLVLYPAEGLTTKSYLKFYRENVHVVAKVHRTSMYKKPTLKAFTVEKNQKELNLDEGNETQRTDSSLEDK